MFLSNLSIKRPVFATVLMLALVTLGRLLVPAARHRACSPTSRSRSSRSSTEFPGASPETVEREVTKKIEEAVNPISGVKHVYSTSREGLSSVMVEFQLEVRINDASQEARAKINAVRRRAARSGSRSRSSRRSTSAGCRSSRWPSAPSTLTPRDLTTLVDRKVKRRLENIPGVGKVRARRRVASAR